MVVNLDSEGKQMTSQHDTQFKVARQRTCRWDMTHLDHFVSNRLMLLGDQLGVHKLGQGPQHMVGNRH